MWHKLHKGAMSRGGGGGCTTNKGDMRRTPSITYTLGRSGYWGRVCSASVGTYNDQKHIVGTFDSYTVIINIKGIYITHLYKPFI